VTIYFPDMTTTSYSFSLYHFGFECTGWRNKFKIPKEYARSSIKRKYCQKD